MTKYGLTGLAIAAFLNTASHAACDTTSLTQTELNGFSGTTVTFNCETGCAGWMASTSVDWHEVHGGGGGLQEVGSGSAPKTVGSWWTNSSNQICYQYDDDSASPYCYTVYGTVPVQTGASYQFCNSAGHKATGTVD